MVDHVKSPFFAPIKFFDLNDNSYPLDRVVPALPHTLETILSAGRGIWVIRLLIVLLKTSIEPVSLFLNSPKSSPTFNSPAVSHVRFGLPDCVMSMAEDTAFVPKIGLAHAATLYTSKALPPKLLLPVWPYPALNFRSEITEIFFKKPSSDTTQLPETEGK